MEWWPTLFLPNTGTRPRPKMPENPGLYETSRDVYASKTLDEIYAFSQQNNLPFKGTYVFVLVLRCRNKMDAGTF